MNNSNYTRHTPYASNNEILFNNQDSSDSFQSILLQNHYPQTQIIQDSKIHRFGKDDKYWYIHHVDYAVSGDWSEELERVFWSDGYNLEFDC